MSVYTVSPIQASIAPGSPVTYTVPPGKVFVVRDIVATTTGAPTQQPLNVWIGGVNTNLIAVWTYVAGQQEYHWSGRVALAAGTVLSARTLTGSTPTYCVITGYLFDA